MKTTLYEGVLGEIYDCAINWISEDADHPDTPSEEWQFVYGLAKAGPELLEACEHAAKSCHHPACKCKGEYAANPERYCTCHVQKALAAARAKGTA